MYFPSWPDKLSDKLHDVTRSGRDIYLYADNIDLTKYEWETGEWEDTQADLTLKWKLSWKLSK